MKLLKRICAAVCAAAVAAGSAVFAADTDKKEYVALVIDAPWALCSGEAKQIDESGEICAYLKNNRTMLPVRFIAENLGCDVGWEAESESIVIKKDNNELKMKINENCMYKNGEKIELDAASEIVLDRSMVPVRFVADGLGMCVSWKNGAVIIYEGENEDLQTESYIYESAEQICRKYSILPRLINISVGGQMIKGFDTYNNTYTLRTGDGLAQNVCVSAVADRYSRCEIKKDNDAGEIQISVKSNIIDSMENVYTIKVKPPLDFDITAKSSQAPNYPENTVDEDFQTRWAAEGEQWILYTFKEPKEIEKVKIAFWKASETRKAKFDIFAGEDPKDMKEVFSGESSYANEELESFSFEKMKAKYVLIMCHGNTENKWNSILEVRFE